MNTPKQLEQALALHTRLVHAGLKPEQAELRVMRSLDRIDETPLDELANEIVESAEDRCKRPADDASSNSAFWNELRSQIVREQARRRGPSPAEARAELKRRIGTQAP